MSEVRSIVWRLYAMRPTDENIRKALSERFHRITTKYVLVYNGEKIEDPEVVEISQEDYSVLSKDDMDWLNDNNMELLREFQDNHRETIEKAQVDFLKEFQHELEQEQERLNGREQEIENQ